MEARHLSKCGLLVQKVIFSYVFWCSSGFLSTLVQVCAVDGELKLFPSAILLQTKATFGFVFHQGPTIFSSPLLKKKIK